MPKYYCDYCDIYLTHDTLTVRRSHNAGWKHQTQIKNYYTDLAREHIQTIIDDMTRNGTFAPPPQIFRPPPGYLPNAPTTNK
jgi:U1 small nuclear ribonucleoprotein C